MTVDGFAEFAIAMGLVTLLVFFFWWASGNEVKR